MLGNEQERATGWRNNWFVKNVLVELPLIGSFFSTKGIKTQVYEAGKCAAMFAGGAVAMMWSMHSESSGNNKAIAKHIFSMAGGMWAGKAAFNGVYEGCLVLHQFALSKQSSTLPQVSSEGEELVALTMPDSTSTAKRPSST